jgi:putative ABC transport system permease protein
VTGFLTAGIIRTALEVGLIYSLVALSLFISYSILNICDLSTDGCYTLGCAVGAIVTIAGHPILGLFLAMGAGILSGFITAFLQTRLGVESILAGIVVNTGLYTINLAVMGFSSNVSIFGTDTIFTLFKSLSGSAFWNDWSTLILLALLILIVCLVIRWFLSTTLGLSIRATGDSPAMVRASSINPAFTITVGLCAANSLTGLAGSLIGQYNKTCDINLGTGMVTIALASLVIGETFATHKKMMFRIISVVFGSCLYRFIISLALRLNVPTEAFKLVSAVIVAIAIAAPRAKELLLFRKKQAIAMAERKKLKGAQ